MRKAAKHRDDFRKLAQLRVREARCLLAAGLHEGAFYVAGYAVECALKACCAKKTKRFEFPPRDAHKLYTHKLQDLAKAAGLDAQLENGSTQLAANWSFVAGEWSEEGRYHLGVDEGVAKQLVAAVCNRKDGVLACVRKHW